MEETTATVADSATTAEAATVIPDGSAAEQTDATHGDTTTEPTPSDTPAAETPEPDGDGDEDDDESPPENQTEEEKSKAQKRRERRQAAEQKRIADAVAAEISKREQAQQTAEQTKAQTEAVEKAARKRQERLAEWLGEPDTPEKPGTITTLRSEIDTLRSEADAVNRQIRSELTDPAGADLDALAAQASTLATQVAERETRIKWLTENNRMTSEIEDLVWATFATDFASAAAFPELSDPAVKARYLKAEGGVRGALNVLRAAIVSAKDAEKATELKAQADKHKSEMTVLEGERNAWRMRAGGAEVPESTSGSSRISETYTRERLRQMLSSPAGMAEYRRHKAEIERQEAAGLIR